MSKGFANKKTGGNLAEPTELKEFRRFLGPKATPYNDAQLRQLRYEMYTMAELLLDLYLVKKSGKKTTLQEPVKIDRAKANP